MKEKGVFSSILVPIYFIQVYLSLLPDYTHDIYDGIYFVWSIFHLFLRGVSIAMATIMIHEFGHWPVRDIQKLKGIHYQDKDVNKLFLNTLKRTGFF